MRVSLGLPTLGPSTAMDLQSGGALFAVARAAEDAGFSAVFCTDHPAPPHDWLARGGHAAGDPFATLAAAAAVTTTLQVQTNLLIPAYRHPRLVAQASATLDVLSGGRLLLGVGAGYLEPEFDALDVMFATRNDDLDAAIAAVRRSWDEDWPRPVQPAGPPIWVGGNSARARRRAVELGDGWVPMPSSDRAAKHLRTPGLESLSALADAIAEVRERRAARGGGRFDIVFTPADLMLGVAGLPPATEIVAELVGLAAIGVDWATVTLPGPDLTGLLAGIGSFGEQVLIPLAAAVPPGAGPVV